MFKKLISPTFMILMFAFVAFGQDGPPPNQGQRFDGSPPNDERPSLLAQLGLLKEQVQQFRRVNAEHRPLMQEAQRKMREANRELDIVIYADNVSDEQFRTRLKAFQDAQNEVNRLRFTNELAIRNILTPEQLVRFREMRRRFAEARDRLMPQPRQVHQNGDRQIDQKRQQRKPTDNDPSIRQVNRQPRPII